MSRKAVGDVRPSQVITTFGPGAIVDLQTLSVIVAGIDRWPTDKDFAIHEPRLERALGVARFFPPLPSEGTFRNKDGTVPAYIFPRYQVCSRCQTLSEFGEGLAAYNEMWKVIECKAPQCKGRGTRRAETNPAPFVVACPGGHLDDFPWRRYVHRGDASCKQRLTLYSDGRTGSVADLNVKCECGKTRSVGDAFGIDQVQELGACTRRRPWHGPKNQDPNPCSFSDQTRAIQRGATNAWFPVVRSALAIKESATPVGQAVNRCDSKQIAAIQSKEKLISHIDDGLFPTLEKFDPNDVWDAIQKSRGDVEPDELDLRYPEWLAMREKPSSTRETDELYLEDTEVPDRFRKFLARIVLARKVLEVRALRGFTRINPAGGGQDVDFDVALSSVARQQTDWLPAVEVRGEGIFFEFDEKTLTGWEKQPSVQQLMTSMADKFAEWESAKGGTPDPFPGARYVLMHSFAHTMIRQLALDCGYSASSVRERIYSSLDPKHRMAGVLLYTASPDSEGSLGGLVDLGRPNRLPALLANALASTVRCSSDPLCADHDPDAHASINAAACHACILVSETSCEVFNRFLDRNVLVQTMANKSIAYFDGA